MCIIGHIGCDSGMKRGFCFFGFALVDPELLEESFSKTASAAVHIESSSHNKDAGPQHRTPPRAFLNSKGTDSLFL